MRQASITRKGQVTIPAEIRSKLGLKPRDKVTFELGANGVTLRPAVSAILAGYGSISPRRQPEDLKLLRQEFETGVAAEVISETQD